MNAQTAKITHAELMAEAFNVYHETGLTPLQLADQRAKLLTACEELLLYEDYPHDIGNRDDAFYKIVELARAAVKVAKQVNP